MSRRIRRKPNKVKMVKARSRILFGSVKGTSIILDKRKKQPKYPHKVEEY